MEKRYYIAYGSNLNIGQMKYRCPSARIIGTAQIKDYRLLFKGSKTGAYLTIEPAKGRTVPVGVWEVSAKDELSLDRYEGYPSFYYKKELRLTVEDIRSHRLRSRLCFVYVMHEDTQHGIPSDYYMRVCLEGYHSFAFDSSVLLRAYNESWNEAYENE